MKLFRNIFGAVWALWGLVTFVVTMFIIVIPVCVTYLIKEPAGAEAFRRISVLWMRVYLFLIGCPLKVKGVTHFKKGETYIVVCNHTSLMDVPVCTPFVPGANKTIAKKSFALVPVFGWVYRRGSVLVDRKSDASRRKSFELMRQTLQQGMHMVIYPEGTRNRTSAPLKSFHDGAFRLAVAAEKQIIPALIFNTKKVLPPEKTFYLMPHKLEMHFLQPVSSEGMSAKELKEKVFKIMWDELTTQE